MLFLEGIYNAVFQRV